MRHFTRGSPVHFMLCRMFVAHAPTAAVANKLLRRPFPGSCRLLLQMAVLGVALAGAGGLYAQERAVLPNLGDGADMAPAAERRLGDRIARSLYRDPDYVDDPVVMQYVQNIWQQLMAASRERGELTPQLDDAFAWQILLGKDRTVNAFALPGGYIGLHLGLVAAVANRDELASVMAHELIHVTQRHISRGLSQQNAMAPWMVGAMILGILAASKDVNTGNALIVGGQAAAAQNQLNYSREAEREADRIGFAVMTQAGFAGQGFVSMFEKLQQAARLNDSGGFAYLRSHPLTTERIADMQARVPTAATGAPAMLTLPEHALVAARAKVLSHAGVDALRQWGREVEPSELARLNPTAQAGALYGASFAALKLRDFASANRYWTALGQGRGMSAAAQEIVALLGAEIALAQGAPTLAAQRMAGRSSITRSTVLMQAQIDTALGQAHSAAQSLQSWLTEHPRDALGWQLLAQANQAQGRTVAAVRAEAEASLAQLDYEAALTRFRAAQALARKGPADAEPIEAAIVNSRAQQVELLLKEQSLERSER